MKYSSSNDTEFSLQNVDNFKSTINITVSSILDKYIILINEYLKFCEDTLKIKIKNTNYLYFIIVRGFDTLTNVFINVFYYTKNLELSYFHSQKSYYYYIEFMEQITDDQNTFLQLNSKDAIIYVYKKTIYEINNDYRKNIETNKSDSNKLSVLNIYLNIFKNIIYRVLNEINVKPIVVEEQSYMNKLNKLNVLLNKINLINILNMGINDTKIFESFVNILDNKIEDSDKFYEIIHLYIKKLHRKPAIINNLKEKIYLNDLEDKLNDVNEKIIALLTA
jgi:hypothetical protein